MFLFLRTKFRLDLAKTILDIIEERRASAGIPDLNKCVELSIIEQELQSLEKLMAEENTSVGPDSE